MRFFAFLLFLIISFSGKAEDWPKQKQIHILVGFAPGSTTDIAERLAALGLDWKSNTSGEFAAFLRDEVQKWSRAVKESGAQGD